MSRSIELSSNNRGAALIEYALLIVAVMVIAAASFRSLGRSVKHNADASSAALQGGGLAGGLGSGGGAIGGSAD